MAKDTVEAIKKAEQQAREKNEKAQTEAEVIIQSALNQAKNAAVSGEQRAEDEKLKLMNEARQRCEEIGKQAEDKARITVAELETKAAAQTEKAVAEIIAAVIG